VGLEKGMGTGVVVEGEEDSINCLFFFVPCGVGMSHLL